MSRLIIVSNRLPINIQNQDSVLVVTPSAGGLATGLKSYHKNNNSIWIGWAGIDPSSEKEKTTIINLLHKEHCLPVFLNQNLIENYYDGFSNSTLWPLFHYFAKFTEFNQEYWEAYKQVNEIFTKTIIATAQPNDTVWIHDYQLMLVPHMLKTKRPDLRIGFFLHIPFPAFEVFRILPNREEIIQGLLGADLIGFHTYDYARYFNSSVKRLLGYDVEFNKINLGDRQVYVDVFPMGIDYEKFYSKSLEITNKPANERSKEQLDIDHFLNEAPNRKLILSIDRLDYTKGIPERLKAFRYFLKTYPEYKEQVSLIMVTVPSRVDVEHYQNLRSEVDELVGSINGELGSINWNPIIYFYRSLPFNHLIELYSSSEIALLTPLRDGMNLVAKEFIATKINLNGVLILSEMAGATKELGEALSVNPNNMQDVSDAIYKALNMNTEEQSKPIQNMQNRIKRYDVFKWATDFVNALDKTKRKQEENQARKVSVSLLKEIRIQFNEAEKRILFLDYDGTLQRFFDTPKEAIPDAELLNLLKSIAADSKTELVIISGRDKITLNEWFGNQGYTLIAEHGAWLKPKNKNWIEKNQSHPTWKQNLRPILESYVDRTPGSLIEEKSHSLVWHYRKSDPELGLLRTLELKADLYNLIANQELEILEGNKVIEVKTTGINKGHAAMECIGNTKYDFVLAIGDDWTDEYMFKALPKNSLTIKVGTDRSAASYYLNQQSEVRNLLQILKP